MHFKRILDFGEGQHGEHARDNVSKLGVQGVSLVNPAAKRNSPLSTRNL